MPYPDQIPDSMMAEIRARLSVDYEQRVLDTPVGESVYDRASHVQGQVIPATQRLILCGFTARASQNISQIRMWTGTTAAGATPTLVRMGVYGRNADNTYTLLASTATDTSLFAAVSTTYTKSFTTSFTKTAGLDYLVGCLVVSAAAFPNFGAPTTAPSTPYATDNTLLQPITLAALTGQADLPSSFAAATLAASSCAFHALLLQ